MLKVRALWFLSVRKTKLKLDKKFKTDLQCALTEENKIA